jgi:predicted transcriptional regulator of viral defense system
LFEWRGPLHPAKLGHSRGPDAPLRSLAPLDWLVGTPAPHEAPRSWGPDAALRFVALLIPNRTVAYNNRISGERAIGAVLLILIKAATRRLGGTVVTRTPDGRREVWSSRVRTLVDAVYDWARFDTLPRGFGWIRQELRAGRVTAQESVATTLRFGDKATIRRIGWVLEQEDVRASLVRKLKRALPASSSLVPLNPVRPKRGRGDRR